MSLSDPEWIAFRGQSRMLLSYPLEPFLRALPNPPDFRLRDARRRGYEAFWEIRADHTLWLTRLRTRSDDQGPDPGLRLLFPSAGPVPASWVHQRLHSPDAAQRRFSPLGYGTTFARETYLSVHGGRLVMVEEIDGKTGRRVGGELTPHLESLFGPDEGAFLRVAFAAPDDAAPRLVYADWLEERQDPRAPVVRLAERLRRLDPVAAAQERRNHRDLTRQGLHWLWVHLLNYAFLANELVPVA